MIWNGRRCKDFHCLKIIVFFRLIYIVIIDDTDSINASNSTPAGYDIGLENSPILYEHND